MARYAEGRQQGRMHPAVRARLLLAQRAGMVHGGRANMGRAARRASKTPSTRQLLAQLIMQMQMGGMQGGMAHQQGMVGGPQVEGNGMPMPMGQEPMPAPMPGTGGPALPTEPHFGGPKQHRPGAGEGAMWGGKRRFSPQEVWAYEAGHGNKMGRNKFFNLHPGLMRLLGGRR